MKKTLALLLLLLSLTTLKAESFKPGQDVLVKIDGKLFRGWVVRADGPDSSIVAMNWSAGDMKAVKNTDLKPNLRAPMRPKKKRVTGWKVHDIGYIKLSPSSRGKYMAVAFGKSKIQLFEQNTFYPIRSLKVPTKDSTGLSFSPDGSMLATCGFRGQITVFSIPDGKVKHSIKVKGCRHLTFSSKNLLVFQSGKMALQLYDLKSSKLSKPKFPTRNRKHRRSTLTFSPDGRFLFVGWEADRKFKGKVGIRVYGVKDLKLTLKRTLKSPRAIYSLAVSKDGRQLLAGAKNKIALWQIASGKQLWSASPRVRFAKVDFSPDGKNIAVCSGGSKQKIQILQSSNGQKIKDLAPDRIKCSQLNYSSDGRFIYFSRQIHSNFGETAIRRFPLGD